MWEAVDVEKPLLNLCPEDDNTNFAICLRSGGPKKVFAGSFPNACGFGFDQFATCASRRQ